MVCLRDRGALEEGDALDKEMLLARAAKDTTEVLLQSLEGGCLPAPLEKWVAYFEGEEDQAVPVLRTGQEHQQLDDEAREWISDQEAAPTSSGDVQEVAARQVSCAAPTAQD